MLFFVLTLLGIIYAVFIYIEGYIEAEFLIHPFFWVRNPYFLLFPTMRKVLYNEDHKIKGDPG